MDILLLFLSYPKCFCWKLKLRFLWCLTSLVIRQKGEPQNGCLKKTNLVKFSENEHFLPPDTHTHVCVSGGKKCLFFGKFGVLCFLETTVLRFVLLPYYRRLKNPVFLDTQSLQNFILADTILPQCF